MLDQGITFDRYRLDPRSGLRLGDREIRLTPKALALLCVLAERPGRVVTKDELFAAVWPETAVGDAALVTCIQELRKALRDDARRPRYIETLHRRGYRFIGKPATKGAAAPQLAAGILVGRERELAELRDALARAAAGTRQIVFVSGEPGIGKTSLVKAFVARVTGDAHVAWGQSAEHYGASEPYLPLLDALARSCRGPAAERFIAALDRHAPTWLAQIPSLVGPGARRDLARRAAGVTRERMLRELTDALEAVAESTPIVLWLEDLHWADVSTIDWLASFARRLESARVLVIATYRPAEALAPGHPLRGMQDELSRQGRCRELALTPLSRSAVAEYLALRLATPTESTEMFCRLADQVHQHTDGTPLFVVGVLDDLLDRGVLAQTGDRWTIHDRGAAVALGIPLDLRRLIDRQLDRLERAEASLLEVASVVGATFSAAAVAVGAGVSEGDVEAMLNDLARRQQLIHAYGAEEWPDGTVATRFGFHHALYREALYERLPAGRRVELHRRVGERVEQAFGDRAGEIAGELAMHFERGREAPKAIHYLHAAGRGAGDRGAAREAAAYFTRALDLIGASPASRARDALEAQVRLALCMPLIALHGFGAAAVEACATRAQALYGELGDARGRFAANRVVWNASLMRHPVPRTLGLARELMALARAAGDPAARALAHRALGTSLKLAGELAEAADLLIEGVALSDTVADDLFADYGEHPGMICRAFAGWVMALMGRLDTAARLADDAIEHARRRTHPHGLAFALVSSGLVYVFQRGVSQAEQIGREVIALAREHGLPQWLSFGQEITGWVRVRRGEIAEGIRLQEEGLQTLLATGARTHLSRMRANLAESYLAAQQPAMARKHLTAARDHRESHGEQYYTAELLRLEARLLEMEGAPRDHTEKRLLDAIDIAQRQRAALLELRAATSLARFRAAHGERALARELLSAARAAVSEGVDWPDVVDARALLADLTRG
jgi:DNA-binding winged helix-turn-helix (wHTH) protein